MGISVESRQVKSLLVAVLTRIAFGTLLLPFAFGSTVEQEQKISIGELSWITGQWVRTSERVQGEELWTDVAGGTMLGVSRTVAARKTVEFEFLRIEERSDGIYYVAHPQARPGTDFKLVRTRGQEAVFENLEHDFPQRIIYRRNQDGSLTVRIEGDRGGRIVGMDFHFQPKAEMTCPR